MDFTYLLDDKNMTIYECSKRSGIPYSTLSDIMHGTTPAENMKFRTAYYLSRTLGITMEELYEQTRIPLRSSLETFKNQIRHDVKRLGDVDFINSVIRNKSVDKYWHLEWYFEAFYLLAMVDYLCRVNNIKSDNRYDQIRTYKLPEIAYPSDIVLASALSPDLDVREQAVKNSIPEFMRFNIVEKEVRDAF